MYEFIRGTLIEASSDVAVVDVGGIGYRIYTPLSAYGRMPTFGREVVLYTSHVVREASQTLYGFLEKIERDLFEILIDISGIGPKTALSLVGHLSLEQFYQAIQSNNILVLSKVPGIGKKTAERLIVEMRGKKSTSLFEKQAGENLTGTSPHIHDALNALLNLGFTHSSAEVALKNALKEIPPESDLSTLIATALRSKKVSV